MLWKDMLVDSHAHAQQLQPNFSLHVKSPCTKPQFFFLGRFAEHLQVDGKTSYQVSYTCNIESKSNGRQHQVVGAWKQNARTILLTPAK